MCERGRASALAIGVALLMTSAAHAAPDPAGGDRLGGGATSPYSPAIASALPGGVSTRPPMPTLAADRWRIAPTPAWVEPIAAFSEPGTAEDPYPRSVDSRLIDHQYDGRTLEKGVSWYALERAFVTRRGVENQAGIALDFDPTYQRLALHEVSLRRGERIIDKLPTLRADLLRREPDLDKLIYDGTHTLNLLLDDVRVGDVLRYAYSLEGENPILDGLREVGVRTDRGDTPTGRRHTRLLTTPERPFHVRRQGPPSAYVTRRRGDSLETIIDQRDPPVRKAEPGAADDAFGRGWLVFGDLADWRASVEWARPLYRLDETVPPELERVAARIRGAHPDEAARIGAALRWVQEEIRYFGIELGRDSHRPARPAETLARRYGDCKGKALLLMALLDELGVASSAALVDTSRTIALPDFAWRLHAFDHVIVHVESGARSHWLDPTDAWQRGALGQLFEPDHARALVLAPGESAPRDMANEASGWKLEIDKHLVLPAERAEPATLAVHSTRYGGLAEGMRRDIEIDGAAALGERYTDYYRERFPGLSQSALPELVEDDGNVSRSVERYAIEDFWEAGAFVDRHRWLLGDELMGSLRDAPEADGRTQAFALDHPFELVERWHVSLPDRLTVERLDATLTTQWFAFEKSHVLDADGTDLVVTLRYRSLTDRVAPGDIERYAEALSELQARARFHVEDRRRAPEWMERFVAVMEAVPPGTAKPSSHWTRLAERVEIVGMGGAMLAAGVVALRRRRERDRPTPSRAAAAGGPRRCSRAHTGCPTPSATARSRPPARSDNA